MDYKTYLKQREEAFAEELLGYCGASNVLVSQGFPPLPIDDLMEKYKESNQALLQFLLENGPKDIGEAEGWEIKTQQCCPGDDNAEIYNQSNQDWRTFLNRLKSN